jgi:hypothetical protein
MYSRMAQENNLPWRTLTDVAAAAKAFLEPILGLEGADLPAEWSADSWC